MAIILCSECGKEVSDRSALCIGCGFPITLVKENVFGDFDGDGERTLKDIKAAVEILIDNTADAAEEAVLQAREWFAALNRGDSTVAPKTDVSSRPVPGSQSASDCVRFRSAVESTIDAKFAGIMERKDKSTQFLTYVEGQIITASVRNIFRNAVGFTPPEIDTACKLAEAVVAPTAGERQKLVKAAVGIGGSAAGIGMIIASAGAVLGWGAGVITAVTTFFVGTSMAGPVGWIIAGITLAGVASYFAISSNELIVTEKFMKVLKASTGTATEAIWLTHEEALSKVIGNGSRA